MRKSIATNLGAIAVFGPVVLDADNTPAAIDIGNYGGAIILLHIGIGGITFSTTNKVEFKLTHSNDNSSYSDVAQGDVSGVTVATGGIIKSLIAAHAAASLTKVGYHGGKRYLKLLADFDGTHGTGTPISAIVIGGEPFIAPV